MTSIRTSVLGAATLIAACAFNAPPVPVEGPAADLRRLAGRRWTGSYERKNSGRSGTIEFDLLYGEGHAHGDVVMIPTGSRQSYQPWRDGPGFGPALVPVETLTIRFVAVEGGEVTGELDAYRDPDCECRAYTRFKGKLHGDVVEGTFVTRTAEQTGPLQGTWRVSRKPR